MTITEEPRQSLASGGTLAEALAGARAGVGPARAALYRMLAGRVCGYLQAHGTEDPEDLTSEVFLRVFRHLDRFVGDDDEFRGWVFTIARRVMLDDLRRQRRRPVTVPFSESTRADSVGGDAELDALAMMDREVVDAVLACLTPDQRDVLLLRLVADLSTDDVATLLHKRPNAVKALQHRAVATLRRHLSKESA